MNIHKRTRLTLLRMKYSQPIFINQTVNNPVNSYALKLFNEKSCLETAK